MAQFTYTTGGDPSISHVKMITEGGYGEVHEMLDKDKNKRFARKIMSVLGNASRADIEHEIQAIKTVQSLPRHPNIVEILRYHQDETSASCYIDMELCFRDLREYIHGSRSTDEDAAASQDATNLAFVPKNCGLQLMLQNAFTILSHITNGLAFAHEHDLVHRDLKPPNVLYSSREKSWKIADFGFTSQAQSSKAVSSIHARGSPGYRAPELMSDDHPHFTPKVDVWAVGCVFYELLMGKVLFSEDYKVREYCKSTSTVPIKISNLPDILESHFSELLQGLLHRKPDLRPKLKEVKPIFLSYITILNQDVIQFLSDIPSIPDYPQWKRLVGGLQREDELWNQLALYYKSRGDFVGIIRLWKKLLCRDPSKSHFQRQLDEAYQKIGDWNAAVTGWKYLVNNHPDIKSLQDELANAVEKKRDAKFAYDVWKELADNHPSNRLLESRLAQATQEAEKAEKERQATILVLKEKIDKDPHNPQLRNELKLTLNTPGCKEDAVAIWKYLVDKHPDVLCLHVQLRWACDATADIDRTIEIWMALVATHPDVSSLQNRLRRAFKTKGDIQEAVEKWKMLKDKYPTIGDLKEQSNCVIL